MYNFPQGNMPLSVGYNVFVSFCLTSSQTSHISFVLQTNRTEFFCKEATTMINWRRSLEILWEDALLSFSPPPWGPNQILLKYYVPNITHIQDLAFNI